MWECVKGMWGSLVHEDMILAIPLLGLTVICFCWRKGASSVLCLCSIMYSRKK